MQMGRTAYFWIFACLCGHLRHCTFWASIRSRKTTVVIITLFFLLLRLYDPFVVWSVASRPGLPSPTLCRRHTLVSLNLSVNRLGLSPPGHVGQCLAHCPRLQSLELEGNGLTSVAALGLTNGVPVPLGGPGPGPRETGPV